MKPFNLQEAIDGKPLITRNGNTNVKFIEFSNDKQNPYYPIVVKIEGMKNLQRFTKQGYFFAYTMYPLDLFMAE